MIFHNREQVIEAISTSLEGGSKEKTSINFSTAYSKIHDNCPNFEDSEYDETLPMKTVEYLLPPGMVATNSFFNEGECD